MNADKVEVGDVVFRAQRGRAHLVESIIAKDLITKCGKTLSLYPTRLGGEWVVASEKFEPNGKNVTGIDCLYCFPKSPSGYSGIDN